MDEDEGALARHLRVGETLADAEAEALKTQRVSFPKTPAESVGKKGSVGGRERVGAAEDAGCAEVREREITRAMEDGDGERRLRERGSGAVVLHARRVRGRTARK